LTCFKSQTNLQARCEKWSNYLRNDRHGLEWVNHYEFWTSSFKFVWCSKITDIFEVGAQIALYNYLQTYIIILKIKIISFNKQPKAINENKNCSHRGARTHNLKENRHNFGQSAKHATQGATQNFIYNKCKNKSINL
jgi:hypothetical protein